jgi:hypothetical protein
VDQRFADFPSLSNAIRKLYQLFGRYAFLHPFPRNSIGGAGFCRKPLDQLSNAELRWSVGPSNVEDFKHFLPRLCEVAALGLITPITESCQYSIPLWDLCVAFRNTQWHAWPEREQAAAYEFFVAFFKASLGIGSIGAARHLCDISEAGVDVAIFLQAWEEDRSLQGTLHLADFIWEQQENLFHRGGVRLAGSDSVATTIDEQVTAWLAQPERRAFLEEMFFQHSDGPDGAQISEAIKTYDWWREFVANKA